MFVHGWHYFVSFKKDVRVTSKEPWMTGGYVTVVLSAMFVSSLFNLQSKLVIE